MELGIRGRVAIVCAASQGLGKATALSFAHEGVNLVICSRDEGRLESAAREIRSVGSGTGSRLLTVVADLTKAADIGSLVATTLRGFGRVDILVTNAGGPPLQVFSI
jgi:3-oxoacyl-[acyl-carrier protein] reductase